MDPPNLSSIFAGPLDSSQCHPVTSHVRISPNSGHHQNLFNDLIRPGKQRRWHGEAERLRGLDVDRQLVPGRRLHWQISRFLPFQDTVGIAGSLPVLFNEIGSVGNEATLSNKVGPKVECGKFVSGCQRDNQVAVNHCQRASCHNEGAVRGARKRTDGTLDFVSGTHTDWSGFDTERGGDRLNCAKLTTARSYSGVANDTHPLDGGRKLLE